RSPCHPTVVNVSGGAPTQHPPPERLGPKSSPVGFCTVGCLLASRARCSTPSGGFAAASSSFLGEVREGAPKGEARPIRGPLPLIRGGRNHRASRGGSTPPPARARGPAPPSSAR